MLGDTVQGYRVGEITPTTVTLVWNHHTELIDIMDSRKGKQPKKSAAKAGGSGQVNIVTVGSSRAAVETVAAAVPPAEEAVARTPPGAPPAASNGFGAAEPAPAAGRLSLAARAPSRAARAPPGALSTAALRPGDEERRIPAAGPRRPRRRDRRTVSTLPVGNL